MTAASTPISDRLEQPAYSPPLPPGRLEFRVFTRGGGDSRGTVRHFTSRGASISCGIWTAAGSGSPLPYVWFRCECGQRGRWVTAQPRPCCLCNMTNSFLKICLFVHVCPSSDAPPPPKQFHSRSGGYSISLVQTDLLSGRVFVIAKKNASGEEGSFEALI